MSVEFPCSNCRPAREQVLMAETVATGLGGPLIFFRPIPGKV